VGEKKKGKGRPQGRPFSFFGLLQNARRLCYSWYMDKDLLADTISSRIADWPDDALKALFEAMDKIEEAHGLVYVLSPEELADIEEGLADIEAGRFATEEEVAALFDKAREPAIKA